MVNHLRDSVPVLEATYINAVALWCMGACVHTLLTKCILREHIPSRQLLMVM